MRFSLSLPPGFAPEPCLLLTSQHRVRFSSSIWKTGRLGVHPTLIPRMWWLSSCVRPAVLELTAAPWDCLRNWIFGGLGQEVSRTLRSAFEEHCLGKGRGTGGAFKKSSLRRKGKEGGVTETGKAASLKRKPRVVYGKPHGAMPMAVDLAHCAAPGILSLFHLCFPGATLIFSARPQLSAESGFLSLARLVLRWH